MANFKDLQHIVLDFESYYANKYSLKHMNVMEYVNHPDFHVQGVATKILGSEDPAEWISEDDVEDYLQAQDWDDTAIICHNTPFDAYILSQVYGIRPRFHYDTQAMSRGRFPGKLHSLEALVERLFPDRLDIRKGKELVLAKGVKHLTGALNDTIGKYACNDVEITAHAFKWFIEHGYPTDELKIIDLTTRMFTQPTLMMNTERMTGVKVNAQRTSKDKISASGLTAEILRSNDQFADYVKNTLKLSIPTKRGKNGIIPAFGKNDISFQALQKEHPEHKAIWDARLASKSRIDETRSTRFLNGTNKDGTISMPLKYYAAHCVPAGVGVLTRDGWVNIEDWKGGDIAQWIEGGSIQFLPATKFEGPIAHNWVESTAQYMPVEMTLGHKVPSYQHNSWAFKELQANDLLHKKSTYIPNGGHLLSTGSITPYQMRVLAMVQADGHWETNTAQGRCLTINLKKRRKIERARELLGDANVPFSEYNFPSQNGLVRFKIKWADLPAWLTPERKFFGSWVLDSTPFGRLSLLDELKHWDGYQTKFQRYYSSSNLANVQWMQTLAHLCGMSASYCLNKGQGNRRDNYRLTLRDRAYCMVTHKQTKEIIKPQLTYCAKTQTGYWLARHKDQIFVTGNTGRFGGGEKINPQNMKRGSEMRKCLVAKDGYVVVVADKSQIEARLTAWLAGCDKLVQAFRDERDIYSEFATSSVYHRPITKADTIERFVGKTCILGLGFGVGGKKLQITLESGSQGPVVIITDVEAARIVRAYRVEFHEIPSLWKRLEQMAIWLQNPDYYGMTYGPLTAGKHEWILPNGMSVQYPEMEGLSFYDARYKMRKTIWGGVFTENLIQALARVNICDDMLNIEDWIKANDIDAAIALQVHDEVILTCREDQAEGLYKNVLRIMATPPKWAPDIPLKAEGGIAKEYSK